MWCQSPLLMFIRLVLLLDVICCLPMCNASQRKRGRNQKSSEKKRSLDKMWEGYRFFVGSVQPPLFPQQQHDEEENRAPKRAKTRGRTSASSSGSSSSNSEAYSSTSSSSHSTSEASSSTSSYSHYRQSFA